MTQEFTEPVHPQNASNSNQKETDNNRIAFEEYKEELTADFNKRLRPIYEALGEVPSSSNSKMFSDTSAETYQILDQNIPGREKREQRVIQTPLDEAGLIALYTFHTILLEIYSLTKQTPQILIDQSLAYKDVYDLHIQRPVNLSEFRKIRDRVRENKQNNIFDDNAQKLVNTLIFWNEKLQERGIDPFTKTEIDESKLPLWRRLLTALIGSKN